MRKSGWAAAAGLGSLVLLLTACGGSSGSSSSSTTSGSTPTTTAQAAGGGASSGALNPPPPGSVVLHVQKSALGYVLAEANGQVVYRYSQDTKGGKPTCTGSCAQIWLPVTGSPVASAADHGLGTLSTVSDANGAKQITYNGYPLYTFKGARPLATAANGTGGMWHVIKLSASDIGSGG